MSKRKPTQRSCVACRKKGDKSAFLRLVVDDEGVIWPDFSAKLPGRGFYLCMDEACLHAMSDKCLQRLRRDFSPQLPQWQVLRERLSDMLGQRLRQLLSGMRRGAVIGRDAVMHRMWDKQPLLIMLASDAGEALVRQIEGAVSKRVQKQHDASTHILVSRLNAQALGLALGREKVSVVAFLQGTPQNKLRQLSVWQRHLAGAMADKRESKVTNGE